MYIPLVGARTYCTTCVFWGRDSAAGLPRPWGTLLGLFSVGTLLGWHEFLVLFRKTRAEPSEPPELAEAAAVVIRRLRPLLRLEDSVESADVFAASEESPVVSIPGREPETSSSSESILFLLNCYATTDSIIITYGDRKCLKNIYNETFKALREPSFVSLAKSGFSTTTQSFN